MQALKIKTEALAGHIDKLVEKTVTEITNPTKEQKLKMMKQKSKKAKNGMNKNQSGLD